jgi:hypothetical protein
MTILSAVQVVNKAFDFIEPILKIPEPEAL